MDIVGLDEIRRLNPFLTTDNVIAAAWTRDDGHGDPSGICNALAKAARDLGATVMRHNRVIDIRPRASGEWEVVTEKGTHHRRDGGECRRLLCAPSRRRWSAPMRPSPTCSITT